MNGGVAMVAGVLTMAAAGWMGLSQWRAQRLERGARLIRITPGPDTSPDVGTVLWSHLVGLLRPRWRRILVGQPHLTFEYMWTADGMTIAVWVPGPVPPGLVERAIGAAWPSAHTHTTPAPTSVPVTGTVVRRSRFTAARPAFLPVQTDHATDPLRPLITAATTGRPGETVHVHVLARPAARRLNPDITALTSPSSPVRRLVLGVLDLVTPHRHIPDRSQAHPPLGSFEAAQVRAGAVKLAGPLWEVDIRIAVTIPAHVPEARRVARGRAHTVATAFAVYGGQNWLTRRRWHHAAAVMNRRVWRESSLLSVTELAALAHLPGDPAVPGLQRVGARTIPPSPQVLRHRTETARPLGTAGGRRIMLPVASGRHHTHVLGATGAGKSTFMVNQFLDDARHGRPAVFGDPKGDAAQDILNRLPRDVTDRLILIDPAIDGPPPMLNPLADHGFGVEVAVDHIVGVFARTFAGSWGPRTDDILRSACLTLTHAHQLDGRPATIADIPRLLEDDYWRARHTAAITDPVLAGFWTWYDQLTPAARSMVTAPLMNKLRSLLLRRFVRDVLAGPGEPLDFTRALDSGLLVVRLPQAELGPDTARTLGSLIMTGLWDAIRKRSRQPADQRVDAAIYLDEAHHFLQSGSPLADMLAQARGFAVGLTLAHQDLDQLNPELRQGLSTNARNKIFFGCSPEDARTLEPHVTPHLSRHDLTHLGPYQAAVRLLIDAEPAPAFTLTSTPLSTVKPGRADQLRAAIAARTAATATAAPVVDVPPAGRVTDPRAIP